MTARTGTLTAWALVPVGLWMAQIFAGLLAGSELCANPVAMHGLGMVLVAVSGVAVYRAWSLTRNGAGGEKTAPDVVGRIGFKVGLLFTAGILLSWLMTGLGACL